MYIDSALLFDFISTDCILLSLFAMPPNLNLNFII